jgi:valyl-tRNA synthetase
VEDRWILSRLQQIEADTAARIADYDFSHAALGLYDFVYGELCDWYLELVKHRLASDGSGGSDEDRRALASTLLHVLRETVAMCHPVIPFVTEELWSYLEGGDGADGLLAGASYPVGERALIDPDAEVSMERAIEAITLIRGWRDSVGARPGLIVPARLNAQGYEATAAAVARLVRLDLVPSLDGAVSGPTPVAAVSIPGGTVEVLSNEGLDLQAAEHRRAAARERLEAEIGRVRTKLANEGFVAKAPVAVVDGERTKLAHLEAELGAL